MTQELQLLPIYRNEPNLLRRHTTPKKCFGNLVYKVCLNLVLYEISDPRILSRDSIRVDENGVTAGSRAVTVKFRCERIAGFSPLRHYSINPTPIRVARLPNMHILQELVIGQHEPLFGDRLRATSQSIPVDELVRQCHDIFIHPILVSHVDDGLRMSV